MDTATGRENMIKQTALMAIISLATIAGAQNSKGLQGEYPATASYFDQSLWLAGCAASYKVLVLFALEDGKESSAEYAENVVNGWVAAASMWRFSNMISDSKETTDISNAWKTSWRLAQEWTDMHFTKIKAQLEQDPGAGLAMVRKDMESCHAKAEMQSSLVTMMREFVATL